MTILDYLKEYSEGKISFKKMCDLANISFDEGMSLIEKYDIEPPIPDFVDEYTSKIVRKLTKEEITKPGKNWKRNSSELKLEKQ